MPTFVGRDPSDEGRFRNGLMRFQPPHRISEVAMEFEYIQYEKSEGIASIVLEHPPGNTLGLEMFPALTNIISDVQRDEAVRVAIITGAGDQFFARARTFANCARRTRMILLCAAKFYSAKLKRYRNR
jgi:hypothetical protein